MSQGSENRFTVRDTEPIAQNLSLYAERLELVARITRAVVGTAPFAAFTADIAEQVQQAFGADGCIIRLREGDELVLLGSAGIPTANLHARIKVGWGIAERIMEERCPLFIPDVATDPATSPYISTLPQGYRFTTYAGAPLLVDEQVIGIVGIYYRERIESIPTSDLDHLQLVGNHLAVAVLNERLFQELKVQRDRLQNEIQVRHRTEEALRHSETLYRLITENTRDMICVLNGAGKCVYASPSVTRILGYPLPVFIGRNFADLLHPEDAPRILELVAQIMQGEQATTTYRLRCADGTYLWLEGNGGRVEIEGVPHLLKSCRDISERRLLEEQLFQAQKMESIGRLAGGIAHDFNNLLTAILGYNQLAQLELPLDHPVLPYLCNVQTAAERATALTRQMLAFARRQPIHPQIVNLNNILVELDGLIRRLIGADVELVTLQDMNLGRVRADSHQFEQVIINLAVNARDAMPEGGKLTLRTANATVMRPANLPHGEMAPGEYILISVTDTGTGMTEEVKQKIFDPFFTTKPVGQGTGLGLATSYGIVKQIGGHIVVDSKQGEGTTFAIYLPRVYELGSTVVAVEETRSLHGSESILLVEDEPSVRAIAAKALREAGYAVQEASHGEEALRLISGHEADIDLLVTDVIMPRMGGQELSERLGKIHPALKVLFVSGYSETPVMTYQDHEIGQIYLQKPFTPQTLTRKVRDVLDYSTVSLL